MISRAKPTQQNSQFLYRIDWFDFHGINKPDNTREMDFPGTRIQTFPLFFSSKLTTCRFRSGRRNWQSETRTQKDLILPTSAKRHQ